MINNETFELAKGSSTLINDFSKKQHLKFREFNYVPKDNDDFLESVAEFHGEILLSLKSIVYDLKNKIEPLEAIRYSHWVESLFDESTSEQDFYKKFLEYEDWLKLEN